MTLISQALVMYASYTKKGDNNRDIKLLLSAMRSENESELNYIQLELALKRNPLKQWQQNKQNQQYCIFNFNNIKQYYIT